MNPFGKKQKAGESRLEWIAYDSQRRAFISCFILSDIVVTFVLNDNSDDIFSGTLVYFERFAASYKSEGHLL